MLRNKKNFNKITAKVKTFPMVRAKLQLPIKSMQAKPPPNSSILSNHFSSPLFFMDTLIISYL